MNREHKDILLSLLHTALKAADPYEAVKKALNFIGGDVVVNGEDLGKFRKIYVMAIGKAACKMARAALEKLKVEECLVVTKRGYASECPRGVRVVEAGHPIPDGNSVKAGKMGLELASKVEEDDLLLVLISGGGSAVFEVPDGLDLEDIVVTNELLLRSGASIDEINTVRKHLSRVKGGKLVKNIKGSVLGIIISDVVGDRLDAIASGITAKDPTTFIDAYEVLKRKGIWKKVPESVRRHIEMGMQGIIEETLKEDLPNVRNFIIASISKVCDAVAEHGKKIGFNTSILTTELEGEAREVGRVIASIAREVALRDRPLRKPALLILGGETTVTVGEGGGRGGPNQELALSASRFIKGIPVSIAALDTDGTDGPTDAAGAIIDGETAENIKKLGVSIEDALRDHDSYTVLKKVGALIVTGPTGTNINSIVLVVVGQTPKTFTH